MYGNSVNMKDSTPTKTGYHHGDLRMALIDATIAHDIGARASQYINEVHSVDRVGRLLWEALLTAES